MLSVCPIQHVSNKLSLKQVSFRVTIEHKINPCQCYLQKNTKINFSSLCVTWSHLKILLFIHWGAPFSNQWLLAGRETYCCVHQGMWMLVKLWLKSSNHNEYVMTILQIFLVCFLSKLNTSHWKISMEYKTPQASLLPLHVLKSWLVSMELGKYWWLGFAFM